MRKGKTNNPNGRPKGSRNKVTQALRERVELLIDNNFDKLQEDIDTLEPKDRVEAMIKLFEYSLPKLQRVDIETATKESKSEIDLSTLTVEQKDVLFTIGNNLLDDMCKD